MLEPAGIVGGVDVGLADGAGTRGGRAMASMEAAGVWMLDSEGWSLGRKSWSG